jgi:NCS1 family nucleobase:cation symporter-1
MPIATIGIYEPEFGSTLKSWMLMLVMWLTPWFVITMTDFLIIHRGHYSDSDLFTRKGIAGDFFTPDIDAWLVGFGVSWGFANTPIYASPLMTDHFGGADLSLFVGALVSFAV